MNTLYNCLLHQISPPVPVYMKFYMWHVTNPLEIVRGEAMAKLEERGPYVYRVGDGNAKAMDGNNHQ